MAEFDPNIHPHRRLNPLTNEYILVSPHRNRRPWLGQTEALQAPNLPEYDPECYLCPGNTRFGGQKNPAYESTYTFTNDFSAVLPQPAPAPPAAPHPLFQTNPVHGACDVIIFHPKHNLTLAILEIAEIVNVITEWIRIYKARGSEKGIKYVQIFENKGAIMGCSNPHPHGQVWSLSEIPSVPATEIASLRRYSIWEESSSGAPRGPKGRPCLLCEYAYAEVGLSEQDSRVVVMNSHWVALVPWWATWPFEILLLPYKRHIPSIADLTSEEILSFGEILSNVTTRYDNLFSCSFAYSMGIHQRPIHAKDVSSEDEENITHLHLHFSPPLLRSANIKKFLVGFELMAEAQRDLTPEQAASKLRACTETHYLKSHARMAIS